MSGLFCRFVASFLQILAINCTFYVVLILKTVSPEYWLGKTWRFHSLSNGWSRLIIWSGIKFRSHLQNNNPTIYLQFFKNRKSYAIGFDDPEEATCDALSLRGLVQTTSSSSHTLNRVVTIEAAHLR